MFKKKSIVKGLAALAAVGATAAVAVSCGTTGSDNSGDVAILLSTLNNPFFKTMEGDLQARFTKLGLKNNTFDSNNSTTTENLNVDAIISAGYKVVIFNDVNETSGFAAIKKFNEAGVEVINIDHPVFPASPSSGVSTSSSHTYKVAANIASDNTQAGRVVAKYLNGHLSVPTSAPTYTLYGIPGTLSSIDRSAGFQQQIGSATTDHYTLSSLPTPNNSSPNTAYGDQADDNRQLANTKTTAAIPNNFTPSVAGFKNVVFGTNDEAALGAIAALSKDNALKFGGNQAYTDTNKSNTTWIVSIDHSQDALKALVAGTLTATVKQSISGMSNLAADIAASVIDGTFKTKTITQWETAIDGDSTISATDKTASQNTSADKSKTLADYTNGYFFSMGTEATVYNTETKKIEYWTEKNQSLDNNEVTLVSSVDPSTVITS